MHAYNSKWGPKYAWVGDCILVDEEGGDLCSTIVQGGVGMVKGVKLEFVSYLTFKIDGSFPIKFPVAILKLKKL